MSSRSSNLEQGRPRDPRIDANVLRATQELLTEVGYDRTSFELVARRAGVSRPAIYRRWPSKIHLVYEAAFPAGDESAIAVSGNFRVDLRTFLERASKTYSQPHVRAALPGILAGIQANSALAAELRPSESAIRGRFRGLVEGALQQGDVRPGVDPDVLFETLLGAIIARLVVFGGVVDQRFLESLERLVLDA